MIPWEVTSLLVIGIVFLATANRAALGFGDALIAMPLLSLIIDVTVAAPLVALISVTITSYFLLRHWQAVHIRSALLLILPALVGIPLGFYFLTEAPEAAVKGILAVLTIGFSAYSLLRPRLLQLADDRWAMPVGFVAGVLGGAYNTPGPPLVLYGAVRNWSPATFRATLQGFFLPTSVVIAVGHGVQGRLQWKVFALYLAAAPAVVLAVIVGEALHRRLSGPGFIRCVYGLLLLVGIGLLVDSLSG